MNQPKESDITALTAKLEQITPHVSRSNDPERSNPPAVKVIDCVLSIRTSYKKVVVPRLDAFKSIHPNTRHVSDLAQLMAAYPTPHTFIVSELDYNSPRKARILREVVAFVCQNVQEAPNVPEEETLKQWAIQTEPQECYMLNIKGFKLASFQYLRMLFGADTTKPDVHIIRFVSNILNRNVSDIESLLLLEAASKRAGLSTRAVDRFIWNRGAESSGSNSVPLVPDGAAACPKRGVVNETV